MLAECDSTHPIAAAIKKAYAKEPDRSRIGDVTEVPARGVSAVIDGITVLVGSRKLLTENGIDAPDAGKSAVYVAADGKYFGYIGVGDNIKPNAKAVISELCAIGVSTMLLSGDSKENVAKAAREVGIDNAFGELIGCEKGRSLLWEHSATGYIVFPAAEKASAVFVIPFHVVGRF